MWCWTVSLSSEHSPHYKRTKGAREPDPAKLSPVLEFGTPEDSKLCRSRKAMEESYETFEEELGQSKPEPPPQKPARQIRRPEMYATRKIKAVTAPVLQQPKQELKALLREPSISRTPSPHKTMSAENLSQTETPWENVTLNRCLFVAITILVLTSGFQKLHETLHGRGPAEEEEIGLTVRHLGTLRHRARLSEPEATLREGIFWWLPDVNDEDDEDEQDNDAKQGKSKRLRGLRNRPQPDKKLTKQRGSKLKDRRAKKARDEEIKDKKGREKKSKPTEAAEAEDEDVENEEAVHMNTEISEENREEKDSKRMK
ncbi:hypothetical protein LDENG_00297460 [Lucifuga dentata]|nr:hypothetical protein LDENG_00297460 [Lucifuga dentata]